MTISVIGTGTGNAEQRRQHEHYARIRHRLMFGQERARIVAPPPAPPPLPMKVKKKSRGVPLDMLTPPSIRFLIKVAALRHGMGVREITSKKRLKHIVMARREAICLVFQHTQLSLPGTGRHFNQDHTTILHALCKAGKNYKLVELRPAIAAEARPKAERAPKPSLPSKSPRAPTALQKAIRRAYQHNIPPSAVAEEYGCNPRSVPVIAHHMGLKRSNFRPKSSHGRADG